MSQQLIIYTDGACKGNPGVGGWGAVLIYGDVIKKVNGKQPLTTNNRMELTAVIEALKILKRSCQITIFTDSQYVKNGMTNWIEAWIAKNWKNVKNVDLWQELYKLVQQHQVTWQWVRGHSGDYYNEQADQLANLAINGEIV
ncbi:MAG: hypothetical protein RLZZ293_1205 [Pseudomonadota bacterium]|jgi:ribonuclease HI